MVGEVSVLMKQQDWPHVDDRFVKAQSGRLLLLQSHDLIAIAVCDLNYKSHIKSSLRQREPPQKAQCSDLLRIAILMTIWTKVHITNHAIWICDLNFPSIGEAFLQFRRCDFKSLVICNLRLGALREGLMGTNPRRQTGTQVQILIWKHSKPSKEVCKEGTTKELETPGNKGQALRSWGWRMQVKEMRVPVLFGDPHSSGRPGMRAIWSGSKLLGKLGSFWSLPYCERQSFKKAKHFET